MKASVSVKIPAGWRWLECGDLVKRGDKFWCTGLGPPLWVRATDIDWDTKVEDDEIAIRRRHRKSPYASGRMRKPAKNSIPNKVLMAWAKEAEKPCVRKSK